eukprot:1030744-Prymnesium_polylepis.1
MRATATPRGYLAYGRYETHTSTWLADQKQKMPQARVPPAGQPTFPGAVAAAPVAAPEPEARDATLARGGLSHGRQKEIMR